MCGSNERLLLCDHRAQRVKVAKVAVISRGFTCKMRASAHGTFKSVDRSRHIH